MALAFLSRLKSQIISQENLVKKGIPSRAEITDAAMAERAECVMLNKGAYVNVSSTNCIEDEKLSGKGKGEKANCSFLFPLPFHL